MKRPLTERLWDISIPYLRIYETGAYKQKNNIIGKKVDAQHSLFTVTRAVVHFS